ncbi:hypothetical protein EUTSA_v10026769mg [Eutrema salsugineum]|uniref:Replication protein A OB domain-containing protein n=1 Tax=Eutrema salsugineum TaxID=72664 RepID=V4MLD9_EUTSA|nr:hypothetical protein EUTSA_v10026769mg [Eutrema salsugineum]
MEAANGNLPLSTPLNRLALGNSMQSIIVRLMRLWEAKNYIRNSELMSVDMLLLDEKVVQAYERYKVTDNKLCIRFTDITEIRSLPDISLPIKKEKFRLCSYEDFLSLANSNIELPDVVGQVLSIQGANLDDPNSNQKIVLLLLMKEKTTVRITIWDDQASEFRRDLFYNNNSMGAAINYNSKPFRSQALRKRMSHRLKRFHNVSESWWARLWSSK